VLAAPVEPNKILQSMTQMRSGLAMGLDLAQRSVVRSARQPLIANGKRSRVTINPITTWVKSERLSQR
jgi:hypothetical protein